MRRLCRNFTAGMILVALVCVMSATMAPQEVSAEGEDQPVYHAALGIQTATQIWIQRWGYYDSSFNEYYDTENYDKLYDSHETFYDGVFEDVEIKGNGTYTVALTDADFAGETTVSQLHVATDIPVTESEKLQFTNVILTVNGNEVVQFDEAVMEDEDSYLQGGAVILVYNHWRDSLVKNLSGMGKGEDNSNGWEVLQGTGSDNVSVTFTVSGLPYDNEEQLAAKEIAKGMEENIGAAGESSQTLKKADASSLEESTLGTAQIAGIVVIAVVAIILIIIINRKKKGSY